MADIPHNATTTAVLEADSFVRGTLEVVGDEDWFRIDVKAGEQYKFFWSASGLSAANGADLTLYDASGNVLYHIDGNAPGEEPADWIWITYTFSTAGAYYLGVGGANGGAPLTGDYSLAANLITNSPLESLDWGTYQQNNVVDVYFAREGQTYPDSGGILLKGEQWSPYLIQREMAAYAEYAKVANIAFNQTSNEAAAEVTLVLDNTQLTGIFGYANAPGFLNEGLSAVNGANPVWTPYPGGSVEQGGRDFESMLHEAGHTLGLAHPHDDGGASLIMSGVSAQTGDLGDYDLNQTVFTLMSYNRGYNGVPLLPDNTPERTYGYAGTPMAFDIALIQAKYGANTSYRTGDDNYTLPAANQSGTFYSCIWDAGGTDTISAGTLGVGCTIDLRPASLLYEPGGGGWVSRHDGIYGGFTIANGVTIENAIGSSASDHITGNDLANVIEARAGNDVMSGLGGDDTFAFNFDVSSTTVWFRSDDTGTRGLTPSPDARAPAWQAYTEQLANWRAAMTLQYGPDADPTTRQITTEGKGSTTFVYDNSFTFTTHVLGEGYDLVSDWEVGLDHLLFKGVTRLQFDQLLAQGIVSVDTSADVGGSTALDTVIDLGSGSITLQDVTVSSTALISEAILFA